MPRRSGKEKAAASWFPGHMAAGMRAIDELANLIDLVLEVRDARVPAATAVAELHPKLKLKQRFIILNREDLADPTSTRHWLTGLRAGNEAFASVGTRAASLGPVRRAVLHAPKRRAVLHVAVVGAPNTGKSSVINALSRRKRAVVQDRAGVTRHTRWLALAPGVELLDTPGVLPPKIIGRDTAWQLAATGCLPETAYDPEEVVERLAAWLRTSGHARAAARFDVEEFARARGMLAKGGEVARTSAARTLLAEFRSGALGRFTFETPEGLK